MSRSERTFCHPMVTCKRIYCCFGQNLPVWRVKNSNRLNLLGFFFLCCVGPGAHVRKVLFRLSPNVDASTPLLVYVDSRASQTQRERERRVLEEAETSQQSLLLRLVPSFSNIRILICAFCSARFFSPAHYQWTQLGLFCGDVLFISHPGTRWFSISALRSLSAVHPRPKRAVYTRIIRRVYSLIIYFFFKKNPLSCRVPVCIKVRRLIAPQININGRLVREMPSRCSCQKCFQMQVESR